MSVWDPAHIKYWTSDMYWEIRTYPDIFNRIRVNGAKPNKKNIEVVIDSVFKEVNKKLLESFSEKQSSGTTAVLAFLCASKIYIAHCGDSRAVWGTELDQQTRDHTCKNKFELDRSFNNRRLKDTIQYDKNDGVWRLGGLIVTRSLGDADCTKYGCIYDPEIKSIDIPNGKFTIVLGSDGVFDTASAMLTQKSAQNDDNEDLYILGVQAHTAFQGIKKIVARAINQGFDSPYLIDLQTITDEALDKFIANNQYLHHDNATVVVLKICPTNEAIAAALENSKIAHTPPKTPEPPLIPSSSLQIMQEQKRPPPDPSKKPPKNNHFFFGAGMAASVALFIYLHQTGKINMLNAHIKKLHI